MSSVSTFVGEVPDYSVKDGVVYISVRDEWAIAMPLPVFKRGMSRAAEVIAKWQVAQLDNGEVIRLQPKSRRGKGHAATRRA